ncbi:MAG: S8 family peptidase [Candidatus Krumholzibacteriota bacterium]|nr:S8 family peptidase [Candidatus Krumholzibacteriota bacterium]
MPSRFRFGVALIIPLLLSYPCRIDASYDRLAIDDHDPGGGREIPFTAPFPGGDENILSVWVFFSDHGEVESAEDEDQISGLGQAAARRIRKRSRLESILSDYRPVNTTYVGIIHRYVIRIRTCSRYFNAVSVEARESDIDLLSGLSFVRKIEPVRTFRRKREEPASKIEAGVQSMNDRSERLSEKYGSSFDQLMLIESLDLLEAGYNGSGSITGNDPVMICILDTGFDLTHEAFSNLNVVDQYDFVQGDTITSDEPGDYTDQGRHGTAVLGTIAGYSEGNLIGPAWGAGYLLAKTEITGEEITVEEDNWIAGIEWADVLGADIVTSSLGYIEWYTTDLLDGETALCTIAADKAVSHGIIVVNSAGNFGYLGPVSIIAPADGDSVIAVGSVDRYGEIAWSSSHGPTADGRIKPDLVAQGVGVTSVSYQYTDQYYSYSGTSFAAPLIAGLCAQLLELHPQWSPIDVRDSLLASASRYEDPDNIYGYGIPRGYLASGLYDGPVPDSVTIGPAYPNPFNEEVRIDLFLPEWERVDVAVYNLAGAIVRVLVDGEYLRWERTIGWDGADNNGDQVASGIYFIHCATDHREATRKAVRIR